MKYFEKNFFRLHLLGSDVFFWKETSRKEHKRPIINQKNLHEYVKKIIIIISTNRSLCIIISLKLYSILLFSIFNLHCVVALNRKSTKRETNENKYLIKISYIYCCFSFRLLQILIERKKKVRNGYFFYKKFFFWFYFFAN